VPLSQKFRDTFRDIFEKSILALWLTFWAVILYLGVWGCSELRAPYWLIVMLEVVFAIIAIADGMTIVCLTVALLIRMAVDTFKEIKSLITGK
jgi:uncharacterized membrane protein YesL